MYLSYYGLRVPPFSITPDPQFVFLSEHHRDALAHLLFGIDKGGGGGFVQLTGEVGTGKTTLSRLLLEQLPERTRIALVLNPKQNAIELLETICEELRIDITGKRGSSKALVDALNLYLLDAYANNLRVVLLIDEAQNLPADALEQVRLLTNLETDTQKLLQILLLGQPELRSLLARRELRQLAQRITARYHLTPLDARETTAYLRHRWRVAGGQRFPFDGKAIKRLHQRSGGVPRLLNVIAERALLAGYARDASLIDAALVDAAAAEVLPPARSRSRWRWLAVLAGVAGLSTLAWAASYWANPHPAAPAAAGTPPISAPHPAPTTAPASPVATTLAQAIAATGNTPLPAWQQLLGLWQLPASSVTVDPGGPCTSLQPGVYCIEGNHPLEVLLALDRPLLLRLQAGTASAWAVLLGADSRRVRVQIGQRVFTLDRVHLQSHWQGDFVGLWRGPDLFTSTPQPGSSGPAVDWLWLRAAPGRATPGTIYDDSLRSAVRDFQSARGLPADGLAGDLTLMALTNGLPGPHLLRVLD